MTEGGLTTFLDSLASQGPFAAVCGFLLVRDWLRENRRDELEKARIEADKALAVSMTILAERVK